MVSNDLCPICLSENFTDPTTLAGCRHVFCRTCIARWHAKRLECPLCRSKSSYTQPAHSHVNGSYRRPMRPERGRYDLSPKLRQSQYIMRPPTESEIKKSRQRPQLTNHGNEKRKK